MTSFRLAHPTGTSLSCKASLECRPGGQREGSRAVMSKLRWSLRGNGPPSSCMLAGTMSGSPPRQAHLCLRFEVADLPVLSTPGCPV